MRCYIGHGTPRLVSEGPGLISTAWKRCGGRQSVHTTRLDQHTRSPIQTTLVPLRSVAEVEIRHQSSPDWTVVEFCGEGGLENSLGEA